MIATAPLDPRVKRTRKLLHEALLSLLAEKSFETISVQDLAERAGVNRVTFYDHFNDKFALLEDLIGESFREILRARVESHPGQCLLRPLVLAVCDYLAKLVRCCKIDRQPLFEPLVEAAVKKLLRELLLASLKKEGAPRLRVAPELGATVAGWAISGAASEWSKHSLAQPPEQFADGILPSIAAALYAPEQA